MSLIGLVLTLVVVGVLLWLLNNYVPMDSKIKTILNVVVVMVHEAELSARPGADKVAGADLELQVAW